MFGPNHLITILTRLLRQLAIVHKWLRAANVTEMEYLGLL